MKKIIGGVTVCAVLSLALYCTGRSIFEFSRSPVKEPVYASEKPAYIKVALSEDGSKTLRVVFDESKGTGKGYDLLYADVDRNGKFDKGEKVSARVHHCTSGVHCDFPAVKVNIPSGGNPLKVSDPCEVIFNYSKHSYPVRTATPSLGAPAPAQTVRTTESFLASGVIRLREGSAQWEYSCRGSVKPSEKLGNAPVWNFLHTPKLKITAKADDRRKGNLGVGLELLSGETNLSGNKAGIPLKAKVEIKKPDGSVAHRDEGALEKYGFG